MPRAPGDSIWLDFSDYVVFTTSDEKCRPTQLEFIDDSDDILSYDINQLGHKLVTEDGTHKLQFNPV